MLDAIIPRKIKKSQARIVRKELNLDFGSFFYPQETRKVFDIRHFHSEITDEVGNKRRVEAVVNPHPSLGTLTTFDERVFYACVEIWQQQQKADICFFSERQICRILKVSWGNNTARGIDNSLNRLRGVFIQWKGAFYDAKSERFIEMKNPFTILNHLKVTSTKDKNFCSQIAEFGFDKRVIENLNSRYSRPINFDTVLSFRSPLAQAVYGLLDRKLYGTNKYHRTTKGLLLEDLQLLAKRYQHRSERIRELRKIQGELLKRETGYGEIIEGYDIEANCQGDAIVKVNRSGARRIKGKTIAVDKVIKISTGRATKASSSSSTSELAPESHKLLSYFQQVFFDKPSTHFSQNAVSKARVIIDEYGFEKAKFLVDYAKQEAPKTSYKPRSFQGIVQYLADALKALESREMQKRKSLVHKRQQQQKALKDKRNKHKEKYESAYFDYLKSLADNFMYRYPKEFGEFVKSESKEQKKLEQNLENASSSSKQFIAEGQLRTFQRRCQKCSRLQKFFRGNKTISIPDFWQWDKQYNSQSFDK